jgi:hypothetical protein
MQLNHFLYHYYSVRAVDEATAKLAETLRAEMV